MNSCKFEIRDRGSYEAPLAKVVEILPEGVLCGSAAQYGSDLDDLIEDDYNW